MRRWLNVLLRFIHFTLLFIFIFLPTINAATCTVTTGTTHQTIRGFGGSNAWSDWSGSDCAQNSWFTAANLDMLFTTNGNGIGLSIIRMRIPPDSGFGGAVAPVQGAFARGAIVMATEWTPPPQWKNVNTVQNPNGEYLLPANYQNYANYLRDYVNTMNTTYGVTVYALCGSNEPDWKVTYDGCSWSGAQELDFIRNYLGPTFATAGLTTKIIVGESYANDFSITDPTLNDATAAGYVSIAGVHTYGGGPTAYANAVNKGKEYWMTEMADFGAYDPSMTNGLKVADWLYNGLVNAEYNAWIYWWLSANTAKNEGLTTTSGNPKRFFVMGNYSKFVRPGFIRIETTAPGGNIFCSAFRDTASNNFVFVAENKNASAQSVTFNIPGIGITSVTPWITDSSRDLASQAAVPVTANSFTFSLPSQSVVSFVGSMPVGTVTYSPTRTPIHSPTRTPTSSPTPDSILLDDMEDGDNNNNWGGNWYSYSGNGTTITPQPFIMTGTGMAGSPLYRAQVVATVADYAGMGTNLLLSGDADLSSYIGVEFYAKGNGGTYWFQFTQPSIPQNNGDYHGATFTAPATWTKVTILFTGIATRWGQTAPFTQNAITALQWTSNGNGALDIQVDNVRLLSAGPIDTPTQTPSSVQSSTVSPSRTATRTATRTMTMTITRTSTATATHSATVSPNNSGTNTPTRTPSFTATPLNTSTNSRTATASSTPQNTGTNTRTVTQTNTSVSTPTRTPTEADTPQACMIWNDEFSGAVIDNSKWVYETGAGGWGNNELEYYTGRTENARVEAGELVIEARQESYGGSNYTSARIKTQAKFSHTYGKVEARIKLPYSQGIWPAFWMLGDNIGSVGWPACGETDIMEMIGGGENRDDTTYGTCHWDNAGSHAQYGGSVELPDPQFFYEAYHIFGIEWDAASIRWYLDGVQFHVIDITPAELSELRQNSFIILNLAVGGNWPGAPDVTTVFPQQMRVDWVRWYDCAVSPTVTPTSSIVLSSTVTPSRTITNSPTATRTNTAQNTATYTTTRTNTPVNTPTDTPLLTATSTPVVTASNTPLGTLTNTPLLTATPSASATATRSVTVTVTPQNTFTKTATPTTAQSFTSTRTMTPSVTPTASPSMTITVTSTRTYTPSITATRTTLPATLTYTPTVTPTAVLGEKMEILNPLAYPNPAAGNTDLKLSFDITRPADKITVRIYTAAFRKVIEDPHAGAYLRQTVITVNKNLLIRLGSGVYYVVATGEKGKEKAVSKPLTLVIIR